MSAKTARSPIPKRLRLGKGLMWSNCRKQWATEPVEQKRASVKYCTVDT